MELSFTVQRDKRSGKRTIKFFDPDYIGEKFGTRGQFTGGEYYVETLTESREQRERFGLSLDGGIPKWTLTAEQMKTVFCALDEHNLTY